MQGLLNLWSSPRPQRARRRGPHPRIVDTRAGDPEPGASAAGYSPRSARLTSTLGLTPSAFANLKIVRTVGFRTPRSMPDT